MEGKLNCEEFIADRGIGEQCGRCFTIVDLQSFAIEMPAITAQGEHRLEKIPKFALGEWNAPPLRIEVLQASHLSLGWGNHGLPLGARLGNC